MKKKKVTKRMMMPIIATVAVCAFTVAGFSTMSYLRGNPYKLSNENGETYIPFESKADIVDNIYENKGQFVILEIVPYEDAGIMEMLVGTDNVKAKIEANKEALFKLFENNALEDGFNSVVTVGGNIASYHPFDISYDSKKDEYSVSYPNNFINNLVDSVEDRAVYNYLVENIEVRTVVAGELTEKDLEDVSLIYVSNYVQDPEVVNFNRLIDGDIIAGELNSIAGIERIGVYEKSDDSYKELTVNDIPSVWYDSYIKDSEGNYISNDMSWDMVEKVVEYIYAGNAYTEGQPIPSIINYGTPVNKSANVYKLMNLMIKTSNEENAEFNGMSTYYKNVMESIDDGTFAYEGKTYDDWNNSTVPLFDVRCVLDKNYVSNFLYVMQGGVEDMLFSIGSPEAFLYEIEDNGSASARDVAADGDNMYTSSEALQYLLNGGGNVAAAYDSSKRTGKRASSIGDKIRVLEIQPCQDFLYEFNDYNVNGKNNVVSNIKKLAAALGFNEYSSISNTESSYKKFLNKGSGKFEFKCVTPQEFNGLNDDLVASYDIIIVGSRTGQMTTDTSGNTIWNDNDLDGYVYLAYGDIVKGQDFLMGYLPWDYTTLTSSQIKNMGGYSFKNTGSGGTTKDWGGKKHIYSMGVKDVWTPLLRNSFSSSDYRIFDMSYVYTSYANRDKFYADRDANVRRLENDITKNKLEELIEYLAVNRPIVLADDLYNCPLGGSDIAYPTSNMYHFVDNAIDYDHVIKFGNLSTGLKSIVHDNSLEISSYTMQYERGGNRYSAPSIKYGTGGLLEDSCIVAGIDRFFYSVNFKAKKNTTYYVKILIDKDTDGRFESEPTVDDFNEVYYSRKLVATSDLVELKDLSVKLADGYNGMFAWKILVEEIDSRGVKIDAVSTQGYTVVKGDTKKIKALQISPSSPTLNMKDNATFVSLMSNACSKINYEVKVDYISANDFEKFFESHKYSKGSSFGSSKDYITSNGYNMVVFGFKDSWGGEDLSNEFGAMDCVTDYIEHGGCVLMSHDVLTFYNNGNFGITVNGSKTVVTRTGKSGSLILSLKLRELIGMDVYGITTIPDMNDSTLAKHNVPQKADGSYIQEIQGYTDWHIYRYNEKQNYSDTKKNSVINTLAPWKGAASYMPKSGPGGWGVSASYGDGTGAGDTMVTTTVDEVNRGQISMYPFNTTSENGTLTIAKTHPQYFRLNLEDEDLVVWYTIGQSSQKYKEFYRDSGKDVANNYYIYSKGNVTYTGAGHSTMSIESELKLFVNTVIRAASAGNFTPKITVVNGSSTKDEDTFVVFPNALDDKVQVDFIAFDEDLATREVVKDSYSTETEIREHIGRFTSGKVYYVTPGGDKKVLFEYSRSNPSNYLLNGEQTSIVIENPFEGLTGSALTNAYNAADTKKKNMYDCYKEYIDTGSVDLSIEVSDHDGATGKSTVTIVEHALFDLD